MPDVTNRGLEWQASLGCSDQRVVELGKSLLAKGNHSSRIERQEQDSQEQDKRLHGAAVPRAVADERFNLADSSIMEPQVVPTIDQGWNNSAGHNSDGKKMKPRQRVHCRTQPLARGVTWKSAIPGIQGVSSQRWPSCSAKVGALRRAEWHWDDMQPFCQTQSSTSWIIRSLSGLWMFAGQRRRQRNRRAAKPGTLRGVPYTRLSRVRLPNCDPLQPPALPSGSIWRTISGGESSKRGRLRRQRRTYLIVSRQPLGAPLATVRVGANRRNLVPNYGNAR